MAVISGEDVVGEDLELGASSLSVVFGEGEVVTAERL